MASFEVNGRVIITCEFCGGETGPEDGGSIMSFDGTFCCGECVHRMGLDGELILPCGLCQLPVLGTPEMITEHNSEYCSVCALLLRRAGFETEECKIIV